MMTYLDYYRTILTKVSFDAYLFHKEYHKAIRDLNVQEMSELNQWIQSIGFDNILAEQIDNQVMHNRMR